DLQTRIMLKPKSWTLGLGIVEPFFFRVAIYDVAAMEKVSEDVYFDLNSPQVRNLVPSLARCEPHRVLSDHQLVFSVVPSPTLYMVFTVLKVPDLSALDAACTMYNQASTTSASNVERMRAGVAEACFHCGHHTQLF